MGFGIEDPNKDKSELVTVNLPARDLGEFLASMLGQRRSIVKELNYNFKIDLNWVNNFIELIQQRVKSQNNAKLISLKTELYFSNGKVVQLSTIEQLRSYSDVSSDISVAISFTITYLIKFPYKESPERQDIVFRARAEQNMLDYDAIDVSAIRRILIPISSDRSSLRVEIRYTDLSWGEDIINLISNHVGSSFSRRGGLIDNLRLYGSIFLPFLGFFGIMLNMIRADGSGRQVRVEFLKNNIQLFDKVLNNNRIVEEKLNVIYKYLYTADVANTKGVWDFFNVFVLPLLIVTLLVVLLRIGKSSYVILNTATDNYSARKGRNKKVFYSVVVVGIILGMIVNLTSSFIYEGIKQNINI